MNAPHFHDRRRGKVAFTLAELLISVAIVGVLVACLFPVVGGMRRSAGAVQCMNNLRSLGSAMRLYIADMNNKIVTRRGGARGEYVDIWGAELSGRGYLSEPARKDGHRTYTGRDPTLVRCPLGKLPDSISTENWAWFSYGLNLFTPGAKDKTVNSTPVTERNIAALENPAAFVLLADSSTASGIQEFRLHPSYGGFALRHHDKGNVLFLDGHLESADRARAQELGFPAIYGGND